MAGNLGNPQHYHLLKDIMQIVCYQSMMISNCIVFHYLKLFLLMFNFAFVVSKFAVHLIFRPPTNYFGFKF